MRILVLLNELFPYNSANSTIVYRVADRLHRRYGVELIFLGMAHDRAQRKITEYRGCRVEYVDAPEADGSAEFWRAYHGKSGAARLGCLLRYPRTAVRLLWNRFRPLSALARPYIRAMRRIVRERHPSLILAVGAPYHTVVAADRFSRSIPVILYKLDPWSFHYSLDGAAAKKFRRMEYRADRHAAAILAAGPVALAYRSGRFADHLGKVVPLEFPNVIRHRSYPPRADWLHSRYIHCVYIGTLYADIRSPEFLFELFSRLAGKHICLHVYGQLTGNFSDAFYRRLREYRRTNIFLHRPVPCKAAEKLMQSADVLVNLGNTVPNQMPSKLIEYIGTGRPIVNLCKLRACPTLRYTAEYPICLNLFEGDGLTETAVARLETFCRVYGGRQLPFGMLEELYGGCTPEQVGETVYRVCRAAERGSHGTTDR